MYRLLIVDDEAVIADGLQEVFMGLQELDLDVVKAYSGTAALEWLDKARIDIVISDIRMPGIDGLQLLDKIKANWPDCRVILLSGYSEFDYVYRAIQHTGVSYLLKTEGYDRIIETVMSIMEEIERSLKIDDLINQSEEQMSLASSLTQKEYLTHLLHGESFSHEEDIHRFQQVIEPLRAEYPILLLIGRVDAFPEKASYAKKTQLLYSIKLIVEKYFAQSLSVLSLPDERYNLLWMMQPTAKTLDNLPTTAQLSSYQRIAVFTKGTLEMIQASCRESLGLTMTFAMSFDALGWTEMSDKYDQLTQAIQLYSGLETEMLLTEKNLGARHAQRDAIDNAYEKDGSETVRTVLMKLRKKDDLSSYLESGKKRDFMKLLGELTQPLLKVHSMSYNPALEVYLRVSMVYLSYINHWNLVSRLAFQIGLRNLTRVEGFRSWKDAVDYLFKMAEILFSAQNEEQGQKTQDTIAYIKRYIDENMHDELSLVKLAEQVYFNPSYLSRLFKQMTGINLSEYISGARVEKAKQLLANESIKIKDVAEAVGYLSPTNFSRFFKSMTDFTPQEYRDIAIG